MLPALLLFSCALAVLLAIWARRRPHTGPERQPPRPPESTTKVVAPGEGPPPLSEAPTIKLTVEDPDRPPPPPDLSSPPAPPR